MRRTWTPKLAGAQSRRRIMKAQALLRDAGLPWVDVNDGFGCSCDDAVAALDVLLQDLQDTVDDAIDRGCE